MITSLTNDKVKFVRSLAERKHRIKAQRFAIEGARLIDDALAAKLTPDWIFCAERLPPRSQETLSRLKKRSVEIIAVSAAVLKACSETETPQGLIAVLPSPRLAVPHEPKMILIADSLRDPGNLGTLLRSAAAAEVDLVLLSPETVDAFNPKVVRGAMGAHFRLPILEATWGEIADRVKGLNVYLAAADGELTYTEANWTQPSALIVGGEASGASRDAAQLAKKRISIPLSREVESLNAAVAASVVLFEAKRQRSV
ncbi:23S rRNA (guanosine-2'-O-)-methyltransferase RlmB [Thermoflexales bacterium]|nr:23S rRNA (guanosine-2'-O-)-methyltransferase RlmB [Thermoflexales bacterium]